MHKVSVYGYDHGLDTYIWRLVIYHTAIHTEGATTVAKKSKLPVYRLEDWNYEASEGDSQNVHLYSGLMVSLLIVDRSSTKRKCGTLTAYIATYLCRPIYFEIHLV